ncbi:Mg transporter [Cristinia sonorae]|uniref:Mg transporter n=1 Tax=Cristinia sonorae TaxID=1940300 RepID=A0A8K0XPM6_9AGAR|nr:Mg transporter [Cristinia sonorae]
MSSYPPQYADAGHPATPSDDSNSDTIEMANLEDIVVTPNPHKRQEYHTPYAQDDHGVEESYSDDDDDEGGRALLGSSDRVRGRERLPGPLGVWPQVKDIVIETGPTLLLTTVGLLFTGELLNNVSHWKAMERIEELIIIIPVVLNLKGNLEMNLSARLGTAANMGDLDKPSTRRSLILGNLTLLQVQATAVSFIAAVVAFTLGRILPRSASEPSAPMSSNETLADATNLLFSLAARQAKRPHHLPEKDPGGVTEFIMTAASAMSAACLSSIILGSFMCGLIVLCRKYGRDPDNIAPPIAGCLGDLVTLCLLGAVSTIYITFVQTPLPLIMICVLAAAAVGWTVVTRRNPLVKELLWEGWTPLFAAMIISSGTGIVLDMYVTKYEGFALLAVVISGLPGSVGSIFISRLSTALHAAAIKLSSLPTSSDDFTQKPPSHQPSSKLVMITLLCVTFPVEIIFLGVLRAFGWLKFPILFVIFSVVFFCIAVVVSLVIAKYLTELLWRRKLDPDMYALPIHSALVDLVGQLLLVACFEIVSRLGLSIKASR